ncbi:MULTISPECIES: recombination mediator RecR [unclassified Thomasclavelia]|uniref:Recombination protein RecR n=2 Tax=Erysipelotrichales TaxID=526525 RepID=A0A9D2BN42_9FIRM|nr:MULTISPECIES: recombination mediator RecR [unclassified Thomasclavelia]OUP78530.1 recombination protein RecR [Erysipelatoclostridium sp. An173]OUQ06910.1 recombination protein RecR [Erysipelatoclostridium sp. An15]HIX82840.1 recombination mediator RecR [Candidatus Erysipelatoclostridium merdavium]
MNYPQAFQDLVDCFKRLPGIGGKSAERLVYHILSMDKKYVDEFAEALATIQDKIHYCKKCGHICENEYCDICLDPDRDQSTICIVEDPKDVFAMEKVKEYRGLYHVLHGSVSIMEGKTIEDLNIASLFDRLDDNVKEVIIATNPTRDGETTALYLAKLLAKKNINTSRIANGLPIGSNIDYADELTLLKSLEGRKKI